MRTYLLRTILCGIVATFATSSSAWCDQNPPETFQVVDIRRDGLKGNLIAIVSDSNGRKYQVGTGTLVGSDGAEVSEIYPDHVVVLKMVIDELDGRERPQFTDIPFNAYSADSDSKGVRKAANSNTFVSLGGLRLRLSEIRNFGSQPTAVLKTDSGSSLEVTMGSKFDEARVSVVDIKANSVTFKEVKQGQRGVFITRKVTMKLVQPKQRNQEKAQPDTARASARWQ